jgi:hypothetical protein
MNWVVAILLSAFFLGIYDLCTKHAVRSNAVTPVLFFSTLTGALVWTALLLVDLVRPGLLPPMLVTDSLTGKQHLQLMLKSGIVSASWIGTYYALKHLPLLGFGGRRAKCGGVFVPAGSESGNERVVSPAPGGERRERGTHRELGSGGLSSQAKASRGARTGASGVVAAV